jgi:hypothetical protein
MVSSHVDGSCSGRNLSVIASPVLPYERFCIELQHKRFVRSFAKQTGCINAEESAIGFEIVHHGSTRIEKETGADREVLVRFEHNNATLLLSVIR